MGTREEATGQAQNLQVKYVREQVGEFYNDVRRGERKWRRFHDKFRARIDYIESTRSFLEMLQNRVYRIHALRDDYNGWFAIDIDRVARLILRPMEGDDSVIIVDIVEDYHRGRRSR